ncbi:beta strand repeat-containing protein [Duganella violaceipulchra]|uniref:IPT/TIG domain-containing protein n=1 Tax=Duganella violaceipulchra TaxID=2849652 RepID=A0AA41H949_9BURK|nr:IPT/TIG domain-containing protein [Duganella violaceicalia]MBV6319866.1 IPT/TIG domain-containing protein [Duganella violaceicalia]MCP2006315.1 YD repeat-containing protein [Duganella violaceicalia]
MQKFLKALAKCVGVVAVLSLSAAVFPTRAADGDPIIYDYDELGRLVGLTDTTGNSATYRYDAAGNIVSIIRSSPTQPVITGNTPGTGSEGTPVTISGSGFAVGTDQNKVRFNQTIATVIAATRNQIKTSVPTGATTGPISVETPTGTAISPTAFTVRPSRAPAITGFTPIVGAAGTTVTINGANFDWAVSKVTFNRHGATTRSITTDNIVATVPANAASGPITIATDYGAAISDGDFFIPPAPFGVSDIQATGRMTIGSSKTVTISVAGKKGLILFDGTAGQVVSLSLSAVTLTGGTVSILSPDGTALAQVPPRFTSFIDATVLPTTGTYTILINPSASTTGSLTMTLDAVPEVLGNIALGGPAVTVVTAKPGQNSRLTFEATAGQRFSVNLSGIALTGGDYVDVFILKPGGSVLASSAYVSSSGKFIDVQTAPVTGIYAIQFNPQALAVGKMSAQLFDVGQDPAATVAIGGPAVTVATTVPGQNASLTFTATAGQRFSMNFSGVSLSAKSALLGVKVLNPDGIALIPSTTISASGAFIDVQTAPVTGTYTIKLDPNAMTIGTATVQLFDVVSDVTAAISIGGPAATVATTVPGQNASLTFTATAGQRFSINFSGVALSGKSALLGVKVLNPDGTALIPSTTIGASGGFIDVQTASVTGTYTIKLDPNAMTIGKATVQLFDDAPDPTAAISIGGPAVTVATTVPGQNASLTFTATAGQRFSMNFSSVSLSGSGGILGLKILAPDGTALIPSTTISAAGAFIDVQTAPVPGTYTIKLDPNTMTIGTVTVQVFDVVSDVTAAISIGGPAATVATTVPGQNASLAFTATAGQRFSMNFSGVALSGKSALLGVKVLNPDGTALIPPTTIGAPGVFIDVQTASVTGTYTIKLDPNAMTIGKATVQLFDDASIPTAAISIGGPAVTVATTTPGQNANLTFNGVAGQSVTIRIIGTTLGCQSIGLGQPDGRSLYSHFYCGSLFTLPLQTLPVAGTYTISVEPYGASTGKTSVSLTSP